MPRIKLNLNFNLRAYEPRKDGACPVEARIYAYGRDMKFQTDVFCLPKEWDAKKQRVKPSGTDSVSANGELARFEIKAAQAHKHHTETGAPFNRDLIITFTKRGGNSSTSDFFAFAKERIAAKKVSAATLNQLQTELSKLAKFRAEIRFADIDRQFILRYQKHMVEKLDNGPNTVQKTMKKLSEHLSAAVDMGLLEKNPILDLKFRGTAPEEIQSLEPEELERLEKTEPDSEALTHTKKLSLLQCYTGLAYGDLHGLRPAHIVEIAGREYISKDRGKTDVNAMPPLFPKAKKILEDLDFFEKGKLHVWTNTVYNDFIRDLMTLARIDKEITSHTFRKTAGSIMLNDEQNPVSLEVVSRILGHKKISTTQKWYAKVKTRRIAAETANFKTFG